MKGLVVGYGSIGQRHARVMSELGIDVTIVSRRNTQERPCFSTIPEALAAFDPDYVVVASRTSEHRGDIALLIQNRFSGKVLVEKPVFDSGSGIFPEYLATAKVAYNFRFHPALQKFRSLVAEQKVISVIAYVGSYLPDWRPNTDYRKSYSADRTLGGGVLHDLSHELDYLLWIFGPWERLTAIGGHFSNLEINSDDLFSILYKTRHIPVLSVHMNYLDTIARREIITLTEKGTIRLDLLNGKITTPSGSEQFTIGIDDTYRAQHRAMMENETSFLCNFAEGLDVMRMIAAAESAAKSGTWVTP